MNKYVVAFWSDHTGELLQELVEADSKVEAVVSYMQWPAMTSMVAIHEYAADRDAAISVIEIYPSRPKKFASYPPQQLAMQ